MEESTRSQGVVRFGVFEVDLRTRELRKRGLKLKLQEKPFQILVLLLERPGGVVTREDMRQKLWPADTFVDFDRSVNTGIRKLREALGDSSDTPRFVETLARRGYRFIAPVERLGQAAPPTGKIMLAVLPLDNLSSDPEQEYFSDGLTEEMITRLAQLQPRRLGVIARTSVMEYKRTDKGVDQIGRELSVDYLIEGSVRRAAGRVRISAQLIQVNDQTHLWAENYERELADVFAIQSEVATRIACSLAIELLPAQVNILACAPTKDPLAHEAYLKGRHFWNEFSEEGFRKAFPYFQQAIQKDPNYGIAYAGLAETYTPLGFFSIDPPREVFPRAKEAARKALEINDTLVEAYGSLGISSLLYDWDWQAAEKHFKHAVEIDPDYGLAHLRYGLLLMALGRLDEALREQLRGKELDPLSLLINWLVAWVFYLQQEYDQAIEQCRKTLELEPRFVMAHWQLGRAFLKKAKYEEAIPEFETAVTLSRENPLQVGALGHAYGIAGKRSKALKTLKKLKELSTQRYVPAYDMALIYVGLGEKEQAFEWLERAWKERFGWLVFINVEPIFDPLRSDPRFQDLLRRMNFPS